MNIEKEKYTVEFTSERAEGKAEEKQHMARNLLVRGMSIEEVDEMTGLSVEAIESMKKDEESK